MRRSIPLLAVAIACSALLLLTQGGCPPTTPPATETKPTGPRFIQTFNANIERAVETPPAPINAARNETASTVIQLAHLPKPGNQSVLTLRLAPLEFQSENARIDLGQVRAYQVLAMPVDANRAGFVRHTGQQASSRTMPRALLPVPMDNGKINVTALRDPSEPLKPNSRIGLSDEPVLLWFDVQIPPTAKPGRYNSNIELLKDNQVIESTPLSLNVYDFVLPDERHLHMVGRIEWDSLEALYPDLFETTTPEYMSRSAPKYAAAIKLLDQLVALAHEHRTTVVVPRLQPIVKWPANQPPQVDWREFDTIVEPWLTGGGFADHIPVGYWPLPRIDFLDRYPANLQYQYWSSAAGHFGQQNWIDRAWVEVEKDTKGRASAQESIKLSEQVAAILDAHPQLRVSLPLEDAQLQFRNQDNPNLIDKSTLDRLMTAASGLIMAAPQQPAPAMMKIKHWLRTDLPGLVPYIGAGGDERDVRLWAWLAFLRQTQVIGWDGALPHTKSPQEAADPNDLTWFYPGRWFGVDEPVPTIQLKWLRRAQQDFEYLHLAQQRGEINYAWVMARLMTKPVQTPPNEQPDPTHGLFSGTTDQALWTKALELLAKTILVREPGKERDELAQQQINLDTIAWIEPQERPLLVARNATWGRAVKPGNWVDLQLGIDTYNASDKGALEGQFQWVNAPRGWEFNPQPVPITQIDAVQMYKVKQFQLEARVNLDHLTAETRKPIELKFTAESQRNHEFNLKVATPVAVSDRREGPLTIDGALNDWDDTADGIHHGPLVTMLDRPSLQKQALKMAATNSSIYSNWAAKYFYVAFKLDGLATANNSPNAARVERNFVDYQLRRAWGEDLCEILIQPVYTKPGDVGQIVHVVCKPTGALVVSMKHSPRNQRLLGASFNEVVGAKVELQNRVEGAVWRGELKIPWEVINDKDHAGVQPTLVRFNFVQHKHATGESSSWAGPIDYGRDDSFMGLLFLRDARNPGMGHAAAN